MGLSSMAGAENESSQQSNPLLSPPQNPCYGIPVQQEPPPTYILLPSYPRRPRRRRCDCCASLLSSSSLLTVAFALLSLTLALFFLYPSDPDVSLARIRLHHLRVSALPDLKLDISLSLKVKIRNRDFFSLDYRSIVVAIGYRGKRLGFVSSDGGRIRARGVSYVDAELKLDGIRIIGDAFYLIEDIARGSIPLDTVTEVDGQLHVLFLNFPVDVSTIQLLLVDHVVKYI